MTNSNIRISGPSAKFFLAASLEMIEQAISNSIEFSLSVSVVSLYSQREISCQCEELRPFPKEPTKIGLWTRTIEDLKQKTTLIEVLVMPHLAPMPWKDPQQDDAETFFKLTFSVKASGEPTHMPFESVSQYITLSNASS